MGLRGALAQLVRAEDSFAKSDPDAKATVEKPSAPAKEEPSKKKPTPSSSEGDESQCRVDVRAVNPGWAGALAGAKHLFVVVTDKLDHQFAARGGPDSLPFFAHIETDFGSYEPGKFVDYDPAAISRTVLSGADACNKEDCVRQTCLKIEAAHVKYELYGPNSNSVASGLLVACGIPREKPNVWAPGWDVDVFAPAVSGTGGEEGGPPYGDNSGGGGFHQ